MLTRRPGQLSSSPSSFLTRSWVWTTTIYIINIILVYTYVDTNRICPPKWQENSHMWSLWTGKVGVNALTANSKLSWNPTAVHIPKADRIYKRRNSASPNFRHTCRESFCIPGMAMDTRIWSWLRWCSKQHLTNNFHDGSEMGGTTGPTQWVFFSRKPNIFWQAKIFWAMGYSPIQQLQRRLQAFDWPHENKGVATSRKRSASFCLRFLRVHRGCQSKPGDQMSHTT